MHSALVTDSFSINNTSLRPTLFEWHYLSFCTMPSRGLQQGHVGLGLLSVNFLITGEISGEKIFCCCGMECLYMSKPIWSNIWLNSNVSLILYLHDLSIVESEVLKSPPVVCFFFFRSVYICLMYLGALMLGAYIFLTLMSSWCIDPFIIK